ncbi:dihydrofolate reductase family protein [Croceimicrobium hydrocarbonivorans]|uniref:Dihydrofolate reductase n=1 Tax=Croceimicrobium hydrocarbonivorans TaxID=2761580 RepID=A0A7H0VEB1_9FLAO|nr:dihydrofolate reductase family protein [Croceimicrobium hydrocarbonivorans]QNR24059.1 dihydrofolate reductase [Croceimicrobium hydrocarbonivorans]
MKISLYIASSADGYIAGPNDDLSFLNPMQVEGQDYGYSKFINSVDTVITGRKTYEWVRAQGIEVPHPEKRHVVLSSKQMVLPGNIEVWNQSISALLQELENEGAQHAFLEGGAQIIQGFLELNAIDELIWFKVPIILGEGQPLFLKQEKQHMLKLINAHSYSNGMQKLHYRF